MAAADGYRTRGEAPGRNGAWCARCKILSGAILSIRKLALTLPPLNAGHMPILHHTMDPSLQSEVLRRVRVYLGHYVG